HRAEQRSPRGAARSGLHAGTRLAYPADPVDACLSRWRRGRAWRLPPRGGLGGVLLRIRALHAAPSARTNAPPRRERRLSSRVASRSRAPRDRRVLRDFRERRPREGLGPRERPGADRAARTDVARRGSSGYPVPPRAWIRRAA